MPTPPKDPSQRSRRNKTGTEATLPAQTATRGPELPEGEWQEETKRWWNDLRDSPMAALYTPMDWHQALDLARLRDAWVRGPSAKGYALVQKASIGLGLDNADRRRNGWRMPVVPAAPMAMPDLPKSDLSKRPRRVRDTRSILRTVAGGKR